MAAKPVSEDPLASKIALTYTLTHILNPSKTHVVRSLVDVNVDDVAKGGAPLQHSVLVLPDLIFLHLPMQSKRRMC